MARKTKEETEKTYFALLESACELYSSQGYARTTINEIASNAGMTRGAFYWHFDSKDQVIQAIWEHYASSKFEPIKEAIYALPDDNPAPVFRDLIFELIALFAQDKKLARAMFIIIHNMEISDKEGQLLEFLSEQHKMFENVIAHAFQKIEAAGQLKSNMEPKVSALSCLCLFVGMLDKALLPFMELDLETEGKELFTSFFGAILELNE